jgi:hypothetical protein
VLLLWALLPLLLVLAPLEIGHGWTWSVVPRGLVLLLQSVLGWQALSQCNRPHQLCWWQLVALLMLLAPLEMVHW